MQKIALIPAYCPESRMIELVKELHQLDFSIVVIDDGSGCDYDEVFSAVNDYADVQRYRPNRGKGEALKFGLRYILQHFQKPFTVVTADADGQHRVTDIVNVCDTAVQHPDSLVLGKRDLGKDSPLKSRLGNGITRVLYRLVTGRSIYETQTGLRAFSDRLLPRFLTLEGHRYEYEIDMMLEAADTDIIETGIETVYFDRNAGSHFRPFLDTVSLNKEFLRYKIPTIIAGIAGYLLFLILLPLFGTWLTPCVISAALIQIVKYSLNQLIGFSEKASVLRILITSAILILSDIGFMWIFTAAGIQPSVAMLLSLLVSIAVSIVVRTIWMRIKYRNIS